MELPTYNHSASPQTPVVHLSTYTDILLHPTFLRAFCILVVLYNVLFGIIYGLCSINYPSNCKMTDSAIIAQTLLANVERIVLLLVLGDLRFLTTHVWYKRTAIYFLFTMIFTIAVTFALTDNSIRTGMSILRLAVGISLLLMLFIPLLYIIIRYYTNIQRIRAGILFMIYVLFIAVNGGIGGLHLHHWIYAFIYLCVCYPPIHAKFHTKMDVFMVIWSQLAAILALGIHVQGITGYGSLYFFRSFSNT